jgi:hypothetical protein
MMNEVAEQTTGANTVLILDIDQSVTRVVLCDVVEGAARLVDVCEAHTTSGLPFGDTSIGIAQALRRLENETGHRLLEGEKVIMPARANGDGVDSLFVTGAPVPAINVGMLSRGANDLAGVLKNAVRRTVSTLNDAAEYFHWSGTKFTPAALEGWMRDAKPATLILIGQSFPLEDWRSSLEVISSFAPEVGTAQGIIVADEVRQQVAAEVLDDILELSGIDPSAYHASEIARAVESELRDQYATSLQREPALTPFSAATFVDRMQSVENVAAFLHRRMGRNLAVLLSQDGTLIELASARGAISVYRPDLDINGQARSLLQVAPPDISRWLTFQITEDEVRHWLLNRSLRPRTLIDDDNDRRIAAAVTREMVLRVLRQAEVEIDPDVDLIVIGRHVLDSIGSSTILVALDSLRPLPADGVVMLSVDRDQVAASFGAISATEPHYAREVIENDFLSPLASCVVFSGDAQPGEDIAEIEVKCDSGDLHQITLTYGEIKRFPLDEGHTAEVTIRPGGNTSVGRYAAGEEVQYSGERVMHGGEYGLIFDGRGRPVSLPDDSEARVSSLTKWTRALDGVEG